MEREAKHHHNQQQRQQRGGGGVGGRKAEPDFFLQWGNKKRPRCAKTQQKDDKTTARDVGADKNSGLLLPRPFLPHRVPRKSENSFGMKGQTNGVRTCLQEGKEMRGNYRSNNNNAGAGSGSSDSAQDKKLGWSSSGTGSDTSAWPKFVIGLTNKEKEEDFFVFKGSKPPQRPKKRSKTIQRTLNLVSPGSWLCELTLERYEVREKKVSKKRPRGLKAMGNMDSESD